MADLRAWTEKDGRANSSVEYLRTVELVQRLILDGAHSLLRGGVEATARLIVAQLAARGFAPLAHVDGERCPMCFNLGWVMDCNDLGKPGPRLVEFMPCFYPECKPHPEGPSGQPIGGVTFKFNKFNHVTRHPTEGHVLRVSGDLQEGSST